MAIGGDIIFGRLGKAVDMLADKARVERQRAYQNKVKEEDRKFRNQLEIERFKREQRGNILQDFAGRRDLTPESYQSVAQARDKFASSGLFEIPQVEVKKGRPSPLAAKFFKLDPNKEYPISELQKYETEAGRRQNDIYDYMKQSKGGSGFAINIGGAKYTDKQVSKILDTFDKRAGGYLDKITRNTFGVDDEQIKNLNAYRYQLDELRKKPLKNWTEEDKKRFKELKSYDPSIDYVAKQEEEEFSKGPLAKELMEKLDRIGGAMPGGR